MEKQRVDNWKEMCCIQNNPSAATHLIE